MSTLSFKNYQDCTATLFRWEWKAKFSFRNDTNMKCSYEMHKRKLRFVTQYCKRAIMLKNLKYITIHNNSCYIVFVNRPVVGLLHKKWWNDPDLLGQKLFFFHFVSGGPKRMTIMFHNVIYEVPLIYIICILWNTCDCHNSMECSGWLFHLSAL